MSVAITATGVQIAATVVKVLIMIVIALQVPPLMVWLERRQAALIQRRSQSSVE